MKKVILSAVVAFMAISANAQSTAFRTEDEDIQVSMSMMLPNWIDMDPENTTLPVVAMPTQWETLEQGWTIGTAAFTISATRHCQINAWATDVRRADHSTTSDAHYFIPVNRLSTVSSTPSGINGDHFFGNDLTALALTENNSNYVLSSNAGGHNVGFNVTINAYKSAADGGTSNEVTYYNDNIHGSQTQAYNGTVYFRAFLTGN